MRAIFNNALFILLLTGHLSTQSPSPSLEEEQKGDAGLMVFMKHPLNDKPELFDHALRIISSLEAAPSCHRLAAIALLESCQSLQDPKQAESNLALDKVKSIFAARLAVCELNGAHAVIPTQCQPMIPKIADHDHGFRCFLPGKKCNINKRANERARAAFQDLTSQQLGSCLNALESRPQWWTSYSNARQNAVVICHAARGEAEREQVINTHHVLRDASEDISSGLSQATERSQQLLKAQEAFSQKIEGLQAQILKDLDIESKLLNKVFRQAEAEFRGLVGRLSRYVADAAANLQGFNSQVNQAAQDAEGLNAVIKESSAEVAFQNQALAYGLEANRQTSDKSTMALKNSIAEIKSKELDSIQRSLQNVQVTIEAQTQIMRLLLDRHGSMTDKMNELNNTLRHVQLQASIANKSLETHTQALAVFMQNLTLSMEVNNDLALVVLENLKEARINLATSVIGLLDFFNKSLFIWLTHTLIATGLTYLVLGSQAARCVLGIELTVYSIKVFFERFNAFEAPWHVADWPVSYILVGVLITIAVATLVTLALRNRRKALRSTFEGDAAFYEAIPSRKRRFSVCSSSYAGNFE